MPTLTAPLTGERFTTTFGNKELFGIGNQNALLEPLIAVTGARRCTPYGISCTEELVATILDEEFTVITGGAIGIDTVASKVAVRNKRHAIAFLGSGLDKPYPTENIELFQQIIDNGGCLISEQPWDTPPLPYAFRQRNRTIAEMAQAVLVTEAGMPSGTFSLCDYALEINKPVFSAPGSIFSPTSAGANHLLTVGAKAASSARQFAEELAQLN